MMEIAQQNEDRSGWRNLAYRFTTPTRVEFVDYMVDDENGKLVMLTSRPTLAANA